MFTFILGLFSLLCSATASYSPISVNSKNPRYFTFRGEDKLLITSTEHFGALINLDFDYEVYFQTLARYNFSLTQTWTGFYFSILFSFQKYTKFIAYVCSL